MKKRKCNHTEKARSHFDLISNESGKKLYKCKECTKCINGTKGSNLTSHLKVHSIVYDELFRTNDSIEYKRHKFLLSCVELVTVNGRAFRCLNDSAIRSMNEDLLREFMIAGREIDLNNPHLYEIKQLLRSIANKVRQKISAEAKNRTLALMMDIGTKCRRSFLGISIQFSHLGKITVRSIGTIELKQSHTGIYLADVIVGRLKEFDISVLQVLSVTTDNGSNVLKMVRDMDTYVQNATGEANSLPPTPKKAQTNTQIVSIPCDDEAIEREIEAALAVDDLISDNEALELLFADGDDPNDSDDGDAPNNELLLSAITSALINTHHLNIDWTITGVNCAAHTLQLAIGDAKKATSIANRNVISLCRAIAKLLRLKSTSLEVQHAHLNYKIPRIEVPTRWCSLYLMVITHSLYIYLSTIHFVLI